MQLHTEANEPFGASSLPEPQPICTASACLQAGAPTCSHKAGQEEGDGEHIEGAGARAKHGQPVQGGAGAVPDLLSGQQRHLQGPQAQAQSHCTPPRWSRPGLVPVAGAGWRTPAACQLRVTRVTGAEWVSVLLKALSVTCAKAAKPQHSGECGRIKQRPPGSYRQLWGGQRRGRGRHAGTSWCGWCCGCRGWCRCPAQTAACADNSSTSATAWCHPACCSPTVSHGTLAEQLDAYACSVCA